MKSAAFRYYAPQNADEAGQRRYRKMDKTGTTLNVNGREYSLSVERIFRNGNR